METEALNFGVKLLQENNGRFNTTCPQTIHLAKKIYEYYPIFGNKKMAVLIAQAAFEEYSKLN